ncbi:hypothetical protein PVL29_007896 [Vitis rotundifolia]|uniref:Uncharacterized protein n=1 Tax=Vitis rotundifolia TaxID=103349 RepID=A0AA39A362_VITRO|nr:hypothetical protein PVL29_007896 [Vitis rotundifolia]
MGHVKEDVTIAMAVVGVSDGDDIPLDKKTETGEEQEFKRESERKKRGSEKNLVELEREPERIPAAGFKEFSSCLRRVTERQRR